MDGKLIVIEGGDGSGKATQAQLLIKSLEEKNIKTAYYDFPRYTESFFGAFVGRYLSGEFGDISKINPYLSSLPYALDRLDARDAMLHDLKDNKIVVSNRYVTSNLAHQASRLPVAKRAAFIDWAEKLEYGIHKMPRPDLVVYLYVPWEVGYELTHQKAGQRSYTAGIDQAEADTKHRQKAEAVYLKLAHDRSDWIKIDCMKGDTLLTPEIIHESLLSRLQKRLALT